MKKDLFLWQFAGFSLSSLLGSLLHFVYYWTNQNPFIAPFSAVNESTWEHMKLIFFPMFLFALIQRRFFKEYKNFWCIKLIGIITGLTLIPVLFYTFNGVFGKTPDWLNILFFFIATALSFIVETILFKNENSLYKHSKLCFLIICLIGISFFIFTFLIIIFDITCYIITFIIYLVLKS